MLKKYYEVFYKDTQTFIEIYITGKRKKEKPHQSTSCEVSSQSTGLTMLTEISNVAQLVSRRDTATPGKALFNIVKSNKVADEDYLNKIIEKSTKKLSAKVKEDHEVDVDIKVNEEFDYNRELFSNYIDFDLKLIEENKNNEVCYNDLNRQIEFEEAKDERIDERVEEPVRRKGRYDLTLNDLTVLNNSYRNVLKQAKPKITNLSYDNNILIDIDDYIKESKEKYESVSNVRIFEKHFNKLLLDNSLSCLIRGLKEEKLTQLTAENFDEEIKENYREEETKSINDATIERFRDQRASTHRNSIDPSSRLSNISLEEVFESTNKKLLTRKSLLLNDMNNIILEEDSNFNANTLSYNLRNNLQTNLNLEFHEIGENEQEHSNNLTASDEIYKYISETYKPDNKVRIDIANMLPTQIINTINLSSQEATAISFYSLLINAQNNSINLQQEQPFSDIILS
jgi:hypothetical protein